MNGRKAKRIRKVVYKDISLKIKREYITKDGAIINHPDSPRAIYQLMKKELS